MTDLDDDTRIKLIGLKAVSVDLLRQMKSIQNAVQNLVGGDDHDGWSADFVFDEKVTVQQLWDGTERGRAKSK